MSWVTGGSPFDKILERATNECLMDPDYNEFGHIWDYIKQQKISSKEAVRAILRRLKSANPHVCLLTLECLHTCMMNCGLMFIQEVGQKIFLDELKLKVVNTLPTYNEKVKDKVLELIQMWAIAFEEEPSYHIFRDTYSVMRMDGVQFPPQSNVNKSKSFFNAVEVPKWKEATLCHLCHTTFGLLNRRHHCRGCGNSYCQACSSKTAPLPKFGIDSEVRVCDTCYGNNDPSSNSSNIKQEGGEDADLAAAISASLNEAKLRNGTNSAPHGNTSTSGPTTEELEREDEALAVALAASMEQTEIDRKLRESRSSAAFYSSVPPSHHEHREPSASAPPDTNDTNDDDDGYDPALSRYMNRQYWEDREAERNTDAVSSSAPSTSSHRKSVSFSTDDYTVQSNKRSTIVEEVDQDPKVVQEPLMKKSVSEVAAAVPPIPSQSPQPAQQHVNTVLSNTMEVPKNSNVVPTLSTALSATNGHVELDGFFSASRSSLSLFVQRLRAASVQGRDVATDRAIQSQVSTLLIMQPRLHERLEAQEGSRSHFAEIDARLHQVDDAIAAFEQRHAAHLEAVRQREEEQELLKRMQLEQKLALQKQQDEEQRRWQQQQQWAVQQQYSQQTQMFQNPYQGDGSSAAYMHQQQPHHSQMQPPSQPQPQLQQQHVLKSNEQSAPPPSQHLQLQGQQQYYGHQPPHVPQQQQYVINQGLLPQHQPQNQAYAQTLPSQVYGQPMYEATPSSHQQPTSPVNPDLALIQF